MSGLLPFESRMRGKLVADSGGMERAEERNERGKQTEKAAEREMEREIERKKMSSIDLTLERNAKWS